MKGYKRFLFLIIVLIAMYIVAEMNRPEQVNWNVTLSSTDKNPYGAFILFQQLKDLFPKATVNSYHLPAYDQLSKFTGTKTAYLLMGPKLQLSAEDIDQLFDYVIKGNFVFISSMLLNKQLMDTMGLATNNRFELMNKGGAATINFPNPFLHAENDYSYKRMTLDKYFNRYDTARTLVLGTNQYNDVNFIKLAYGKGAFFVHLLPLCFSNDFLLTESNADYTAKALSYLPANIDTLLWDEYYKKEQEASQTPLRYLLSNTWLRLALYTGLVTMIIFVFFEMKRKQKIIPVITPLQNNTLDFVHTVSNVYFNNHDNKNIALKKIAYFLDSIRSDLNIQTSVMDDDFITVLSRKTGIQEERVAALFKNIEAIQHEQIVTDEQLLEFNRQVDAFNAALKS